MLWNVIGVENQIGAESNCMYCNMKVSKWNVMVGDESNRDGLEHDGLQHENIL